MLPNMGFLKILFFIAYKQNFIASDYRQDLFMLNNYQFTKYFIKLGVVVCVFLCILGGGKSTAISSVFPNEVLQSKGKGKMQ